MLFYLLKRILYFIPTLVLISIIVFFLSKCAGEELQCIHEPNYDEARCIEEASQKGFNKPIFYWNLTTAAHPDTLYKIYREERRITLNKLIGLYGNWESIQTYYQRLALLEESIRKAQLRNNSNALIKMKKSIDVLFVTHKPRPIDAHLKNLAAATNDTTTIAFNPLVKTIQQNYQNILSQATPYKLYIPNLNWYGLDNQYHHWVSNFVTGNWGRSYKDRRSVKDKIATRLPWTLAITLPAILLAYLLSIPIGVYTAIYKDSKLDRYLSNFLLFIYSMPLFWIGTLAVMFFTTPEYGMKIFPSIWLASLSKDIPIWQQIMGNAHRLILPILCMTYGSLAFISRQLRSSMLEVLQQDFIRTARAKGLSEKKIIWKHAFKNALFPLITIFANVLPAAFSGSVIIEVIFNIQGMGYLMFNSILSKDWQVVYPIIMIASILTIIGILIADILYALVDPRVQYKRK